jgi:hypothetical protein
VRGVVLAWGDWVIAMAGMCRRKIGGRAFECNKSFLSNFSDPRRGWRAEGVNVPMCHPAVPGREISE